MDWSAIYDNHGEEEGHWEDHGETRSSRMAHRILHRKLSMSFQKQEEETQKYSSLVAYAFTVNYILGVGSLGIPYAFYKSGLVLGNIMIVIVSIISYITVMWVCESIARARETHRLVNEKSVLLNQNLHQYDDFPEVTQLCERFLGKIGSRMYQISLLGLMYGGLLGYSQVFINSFLKQVDHFGSVEITSGHAALIFGAIVIPLSCSDLTEQIVVQLAMSIVRFVALMIMIFSALYAIYADPYDSGMVLEPDTFLNSTDSLSSPPYLSDYSLADFRGFGIMFSTGVFSQLFQHSVPGLLAPLGKQNQSQAGAIFGSTLTTTMLFYIALGSICSIYFGPKTLSSVNLNWAEFTWGFAESVSLLSLPLWAKFMSMVVVVFPALDTLSVYPLISITLGDNMAAVLPDSFTSNRNTTRSHGSSSGRNCWKLVCRLTASVPPLLIAVFVSDLAITLQVSGIFGIYVAFFAPAFLQFYAIRENPEENVYSGWFSSFKYIYGILIFGIFALAILIYQFIQQIT